MDIHKYIYIGVYIHDSVLLEVKYKRSLTYQYRHDFSFSWFMLINYPAQVSGAE